MALRDLTPAEQAALDDVFMYHPATPEQLESYQAIRAAAKDMAATILRACPECPDRTVALRGVREVVMTANAAVALAGRGLR